MTVDDTIEVPLLGDESEVARRRGTRGPNELFRIAWRTGLRRIRLTLEDGQ